MTSPPSNRFKAALVSRSCRTPQPWFRDYERTPHRTSGTAGPAEQENQHLVARQPGRGVRIIRATERNGHLVEAIRGAAKRFVSIARGDGVGEGSAAARTQLVIGEGRRPYGLEGASELVAGLVDASDWGVIVRS